jgi:hypothetical protein
MAKINDTPHHVLFTIFFHVKKHTLFLIILRWPKKPSSGTCKDFVSASTLAVKSLFTPSMTLSKLRRKDFVSASTLAVKSLFTPCMTLSKLKRKDFVSASTFAVISGHEKFVALDLQCDENFVRDSRDLR